MTELSTTNSNTSKHCTAKQAVDQVNPERWAKISIQERLKLLRQVRENMKRYAHELASSDTKMKDTLMGESLYSDPVSMVGTVVPMSNTITACIDLYESLAKGEMLKPISVDQVKDGLYDIHVFPQDMKDKIMYADRKDFIRVKGEPKQVNPMGKTPGVIAVLGAGNYSSSLEVIKALFLENCVVIHKPHQLNEETDTVWGAILKPLMEIGALSFCAADQGKELTQDERLTKIYFTGGSSTAQAIMSATDTKLVSECGGNNPCIIVPGDRPWTTKELDHQAIQIATMAKLNGGAVCGRPQTLVTSKHWPQRKAFLDALRQALEHETPAAGTYYPGSAQVAEEFQKHHPDAEIVKPERGKYKNANFMLITGADEEAHCVTHEAFCQILNEVPLEVPANANAFLPKAVQFCNTKLLGTLGSCILIDEDTKKAHNHSLQQAITDMEYGSVAINTMPPFIFLNPYLTWGGNEEGKEFVSGQGNFGNLLCYENVEKSIIYASFMSPGHMLNTNKATMDNLSQNMAYFSMEPTWGNMCKLMWGAISGNFKNKDF